MMNSESMNSLAQSEPDMNDAASQGNQPDPADSLDNTESSTANNQMTVDNNLQNGDNQSLSDNNNTGKQLIGK